MVPTQTGGFGLGPPGTGNFRRGTVRSRRPVVVGGFRPTGIGACERDGTGRGQPGYRYSNMSLIRRRIDALELNNK